MFVNIHTHRQIYDASLELVNLGLPPGDRPKYYSCGLHPWRLSKNDYEEQLQELRNIVQEKSCVAVGECGIDKLCATDAGFQKDAFSQQIAIANLVKKPIIVHCVKSFNEVLNCLNLGNNAVPVIIHGFNNNEHTARLLMDHNCFFSFGKALLGYDSNAARALKSVGRKKFFLETDDADISIKYIYRKAADLLGIDEEILREQMRSNVSEVFGIKL